MVKASDVLADIFAAKNRISMDFPHEGNLNDILSFGFSYIEHEDFMVAYVATDPKMMKQVFAQVFDSRINMINGYIGKLWTADLIVSTRVRDNHIIFSNMDLTVILDLNTNKIGATDAGI